MSPLKIHINDMKHTGLWLKNHGDAKNFTTLCWRFRIYEYLCNP